MIKFTARAVYRRHTPGATGWRRSSTDVPTTALYTWGVGTDGQLGHLKFQTTESMMGESYVQEEPRRLLKSKTYTQVAIGGEYTLALNETGHLFGWGNVLGSLRSTTPQLIVPDKTFIHVAAGTKHAAAVDKDGQVYTWGSNGGWFAGGGQLGHDSYDAVVNPKLIESFKEYGAKASRVAVGETHTLILTSDGEVLGCGVGEFGRVGNGSTSDVCVPVTLEVLEDEIITQLVTGTHHSIALTEDGKMYTWGKNDTGALGHVDSHIDMYSLEEFPRLLTEEGMSSASYVAAGSGRSAFVSEEGVLYLWGRNMGHVPAALPMSMFDGLKVIKVALGGEAGKSVVAIITEDHGLWTLGDGSSKLMGFKGAGWKNPSASRVPLLIGKKVLDVYCGPGQHLIAKVVVDND